MNTLTITGRLGRDPEAFNYGQNKEKQGCRFSVAVDRPREDDPDWFQVTAFGQSADFALRFLQKGREVAITGDVHLDTWEKDGETRAALDLVANRVEGIGPRQEDGQPASQRQQAAPKTQAAPKAAPDIDWSMDEDEDPYADE